MIVSPNSSLMMYFCDVIIVVFWSLLRCNTSNIQKKQYNPQNVKNFSIIFIRFQISAKHIDDFPIK